MHANKQLITHALGMGIMARRQNVDHEVPRKQHAVFFGGAAVGRAFLLEVRGEQNPCQHAIRGQQFTGMTHVAGYNSLKYKGKRRG